MKLLFLLNLIFQVKSFLTKPDIFILNGLDTIFFENVNFKGKTILPFFII